ncbi:hypothetical protein COLSTE_01254 [Collinsella stercoris DSM 13279]|uniref:Uncharacterized protein n=1 Tax=Collinsella stercoris DSM 13279 TaxID=445975 RepID=B6GB02_9ACTN|nr:hypothetical protein COLSTE_01254 [Collinsella stercoris DSM 13279]
MVKKCIGVSLGASSFARYIEVSLSISMLRPVHRRFVRCIDASHSAPSLGHARCAEAVPFACHSLAC